jgi:uncharacterized protein (TIGR03067 family)
MVHDVSECGRRAVGADRENTQLQGAWSIHSLELNGRKSPPQVLSGYSLVVEGDVFALQAERRKTRWVYSLDPSKSPKEIDLFAMKNGREVKLPGIYHLENDVLTICRALTPGGKRPAEFETAKGSQTSLITWKRARASR